MPHPDDSSKASALQASLEKLRKTIDKSVDEYKELADPRRDLLMTFLKGIVYGLGALAAVAIVIPLLLMMMRGVSWVPLVGDFVSDVVERVEEAREQ